MSKAVINIIMIFECKRVNLFYINNKQQKEKKIYVYIERGNENKRKKKCIQHQTFINI